jgi:hypothetical protein
MGFVETITLAVTKREPKTPMAFYNRLLVVIVAFIVAPLYSNITPTYKPVFPYVGIGLAVALFVWVSVFAWKKPKHLLYGAEAHFEEWKFERKNAGSGKSLAPRFQEEIPERIITDK